MISVILPVYGVEKYIADCIRSVLAQTFRDFEIIVVNDGTKDMSAIIAEKILSEAGQVNYRIIHTENRGVSAARNTGIRNAAGDYLVMVDSDDILAADFLENYMKMIHHNPNGDVYSSGFQVVSEEERFKESQGNKEILKLDWEEAQKMFLDRSVKFLLPTLLLRRTFVIENSIYFDEKVRYSEDVQYIWRVLAYNRRKVVHSTAKNYNYVLHPGSTMTASGIQKILTGCQGIIELYSEINNYFCDSVRESIISRSFFSLLHGAAHMLSYEQFISLYDQGEFKRHIVDQIKSGNLKSRLVSFVLLASKKMGYYIMKSV